VTPPVDRAVPDVTVREPSTGDIDAVVEYWVGLADGQREYGSHLLADENRSAVREAVARRVATDGLRVADSDGDVVGFVTFEVERGPLAMDATRGVVDDLYVRPSFRGEGVGRRLLAAAERRLVADGADVLGIEAMADNGAARRLYEREGYDPHRVAYEKPVGTESDTSDGR